MRFRYCFFLLLASAERREKRREDGGGAATTPDSLIKWFVSDLSPKALRKTMLSALYLCHRTMDKVSTHCRAWPHSLSYRAANRAGPCLGAHFQDTCRKSSIQESWPTSKGAPPLGEPSGSTAGPPEWLRGAWSVERPACQARAGSMQPEG